MAIEVSCGKCSARYRLAETLAGRKVKCKKCGTAIKVPAVEEDLDPWDVDEALEDEPFETPAAPVSRSAPRTSARSGSRRGAASPSKSKSKSASSGVNGLLVGSICAGIALVVMAGGLLIWGISRAGSPVSLPATGGGPAAAASSLPTGGRPTFPELGPAIHTFPSGVKLHFVSFVGEAANQNRSGPGMWMTMQVYVPAGEHAAGSLPCVLVAPAGTNLLVGCALDGDGYHDETLPYAEAGMVTIFYSLDGPCDLESATDATIAEAYLQFRDTKAGVLNGQLALEYALEKLPQVDSQRIATAGHSSAATLSLLMAEKEPRVAACIAYCPSTDLVTRMAEVINTPSIDRLLPGVKAFLEDSSPLSHVADIKCPVFLLGVRDDGNTPYADTASFAERLKQQGVDVTLLTESVGGHYQPMVDVGVPAAVDWLKTRFVSQ